MDGGCGLLAMTLVSYEGVDTLTVAVAAVTLVRAMDMQQLGQWSQWQLSSEVMGPQWV